MITLNNKQLDFFFDNWFEDNYDLYKIFDTADRDYLKTKTFTIDTNGFGFKNVYMNGKLITGINASGYYAADFEKLLKM